MTQAPSPKNHSHNDGDGTNPAVRISTCSAPHPMTYAELVQRSLLEDFGRGGGDLTTEAIIPQGQQTHARLVARSPTRVAGLPMAAAVFKAVDPTIELAVHIADGEDADAGDTVFTLKGDARGILAAERAALNICGQLSGTATLTSSFVQAVAHTRAKVVCTRKTIPGLRTLQKYAVRCGGGFNHRFGLDDAVLIKDNHLAVAGSVRKAIESVRAHVGHLVKIELEVDTIAQLEQGLRVGVDAVLLDNMPPATLKEAVQLVHGEAITEASGGIDLQSAAAKAESGVDLLSVGALTHSAPCADLSLEIVS